MFLFLLFKENHIVSDIGLRGCAIFAFHSYRNDYNNAYTPRPSNF